MRKILNLPDDAMTWLPGPNVNGVPSRWVPPGARLSAGDCSVGVAYDERGKGHIDYSAIRPVEAVAHGLLIDDLDIGRFLRIDHTLAFVTSDGDAYPATGLDEDGSAKTLDLPRAA